MKTKNYKLAGFTLIEVSVVVIIIGFLLGGLLIYDEIRESAENLSLVKDIRFYETAFETFKAKYGAVAGDMRDAANYWPQYNTSDNQGSGSSINGNGNGLVIGHTTEEEYAFDHLKGAGLVKGDFTGAVFPRTINDKAWVRILYVGTANTTGSWAPAGAIYGRTGHILAFGDTTNSSASGKLARGFLTPIEAEVLDAKIDDGSPAAGNLMALKGIYTSLGITADGSNIIDLESGCVTGTDNDFVGGNLNEMVNTVEYDMSIVTAEKANCRIQYWLD